MAVTYVQAYNRNNIFKRSGARLWLIKNQFGLVNLFS